MTKAETINFGEDRIGLFGGKMDEFIETSVEALKRIDKYPKVVRCEDCKYRKDNGVVNTFYCLYWSKLTTPDAFCSNGIKVE